MTELTTCLWFDGTAEEAADFYTSVFKDSHISDTSHYGEGAPMPAGTVLTVEFEVLGQKFVGLNGGPDFSFSEAVSFQIPCEDQDEVDFYWDTLGEGGEHGPCGWLKDKFGLSWQVVPNALPELLSDPDPARAQRAMAAMMTMGKLDIAELRAAADAG